MSYVHPPALRRACLAIGLIALSFAGGIGAGHVTTTSVPSRTSSAPIAPRIRDVPYTRRRVLAATATPFAVNYANMKYTLPSINQTGCTRPSQYAYLTASCYSTVQTTCAYPTNGSCITAKALIVKDLTYMKTNHLGTFTKVVVSIDQLFNQALWSNTTGFGGYDTTALANFDDMLHTAAGLHVKLGLILFQKETSMANSFHAEALDGLHPQMRANYLTALSQLMTHIAADPIDLSAIAMIDLQGEAYYHLDTYFEAAQTNLGVWNYAEPAYPNNTRCLVIGNTVCTGRAAGKGCTSGANVDETCVRVNIVLPWLKDIYTTAKAAASSLLYTDSDSGGEILTTNPGGNPYQSQSYLLSLYQYSDLYEVHLYDDNPGSAANVARYQTATNFSKPWFIGEAGCSTTNNACTYNGNSAQALTIDSYWLNNMAQYGAQAVEIEEYSATAVTYSQDGTNTPSLSSVGQTRAPWVCAARGTDTPSCHYPRASRG